MSGPLVVVMGVAGAGKSAVGEALAARLGVPFVDGDALHPASNIAKMASGRPLVDDDRWPWLEAVGDALRADRDTGIVVACSALKVVYRDAIRRIAPSTLFVHLHGAPALLADRIGARAGHFMPPALLESQLADLEPLRADEVGTTIDVAPELPEIVREIESFVEARGAQ